MGDNDSYGPLEYCRSSLQIAAEIINFFNPSLQHLVLDINIDPRFRDLPEIDFSPLAPLGAASEFVSIPHIDLYVRTGILLPDLTQAELLSSLGVSEDVVKLIREGILIIHPEMAAPECTEGKWASVPPSA
jgi:hypothetical protein